MSDVLSQAAASPRRTLVARLKRYPLLTAGLIYLGLVCIAFPSVALNPSVAIPGISGHPGDYSIFYWNIWWFQHAIFRLGQTPYFTNFILYPHMLNLAYHTFAPFLDAMAIPFYAVLGLTAAVNTLMLGSLVFDGVAMFAFLRHHVTHFGLAFVGGLLFTFNSLTTVHLSMSHMGYLPIGWLPLALLACDRLIERKTVIAAVVLSGVVYAALMTDSQFGLWLGLLLPPYALYRWARSARQVLWKLFALGLLSLAVFSALIFIAPLPQLVAGRNASYPHLTAYDELGYIKLDNLIGIAPRPIESEDQVILGLLLPFLVVVGIIRSKRRSNHWLWLLGALAFLVLAMGPTLHPFEIPLPYRLIHVAMGGFYRAPVRFMMQVIFMLIVFAMISLRSDYERLSRAGRYIGLAVVVLVLALENRWSEPFPTFTPPDYQIYHTIGAEPDQYLILEVPVGADNSVTEGFGQGAQLQYYAMFHHKQLINGQISRAPIGTTHDYRQWKVITALAEEGPIPELTAARTEFQQLSHDWDIRYVIIHRDMVTPDLGNWASEFFNTEPGWCLVDEEGPVLAYHRLDGSTCVQANLLDPPPDGTINIGDGNDDRYLGLGWYLGENVGGPQARWTGVQATSELRVHLLARSYRVTIQATAFVPTQTVSVSINGTHLSDLSISAAGWGQYTFDLPAAEIPADGLVTLGFTSSHAQSAYDRTGGQVDDKRLLAVAYDSIGFTPIP